MIRPGLKSHQVRLASALALAERILGHRTPLYPPALVDTARQVFAVVGAVCKADRKEQGDTYVAVVVEELVELGGEWTEARLRGLLRLAEEVQRWLPDAADAPGEVGDVEAATPAMAAWAIGRRARKSGDSRRATEWFWRAVRAGRAIEDWAAVSRGYSGLGKVASAAGREVQSRRMQRRALRIARAHGCREEAGMIYHDLLVVAAQDGDATGVRRFADRARRAFGRGAPGLRPLAADIATFYQDTQRYRAAWAIIDGLLGCSDAGAPTYLSLLVNASYVQAAMGGVAAARRWRSAALACLDLRSEEHAASALLTLAEGALFLGEIAAAEDFVERALAVATQRGDVRWRTAAEEFRASLRERGVDVVEKKRGECGSEADAAVADQLAMSLAG